MLVSNASGLIDLGYRHTQLGMPAVSVVMPVHNAKKTVEHSVQSILDSTLTDFELIIVDDGSTDGTPTALRRFVDPRIRIVTQSHRGVAEAMNRGVAESSSLLIARMDADDFSYPTRLETQLQLLQSGGTDIASCRVKIVDAAGDPVLSMKRYETWLNSLTDPKLIRAMRFVESPLVNPSIMARREVWELGCREGPWPEDYDLWLRALESGFQAAKASGVLFDWRDSEHRLTRTGLRYTRKAFDRCRRMHLLNGPLKGSREVDVWGAGSTGKPWIRWLQSEGIRVRRIIEVSVRKIGQHIHNAPVIAPGDMPEADGTLMLIAVGAIGARELIETHLDKRRYCPGNNAWFVA